MALLLCLLASTPDKEQRGPVYDRGRRPVTVANCQFPAHLPSSTLLLHTVLTSLLMAYQRSRFKTTPRFSVYILGVENKTPAGDKSNDDAMRLRKSCHEVKSLHKES